MNKINWFDMSLAWKFFSGMVLLVFVLVGILSAVMKATFMEFLGVELGVIIAWLIGMLGYGTLVYLVRHTRRP